MAKKRERCKHGNPLVYVQGCPTCCMSALAGLRIIEDNDLTPELLMRMLRHAFPTKEALNAAIARAKAEADEAEAARDAEKSGNTP